MKSIALVATITLAVNRANADVTAITNQEQWQAAVGPCTILTFTDLPNFTTVTNQYMAQGILFTDGNDFVHTTTAYSDNHGLVSSDGFGNPGTIHLAFTQPSYALAFAFLDHLELELYRGGRLIFTSNQYSAGFTPFVGFISTTAFDAAIARDLSDDVVAIDNLYFGPPIPAPAGLALFGLAVATATGRRKIR